MPQSHRFPNLVRHLPPVFLLLLLAACGGADAAGAGDGAGVTGASEWEAELVYRWGSIDDPDRLLTRITQVVIGEAGELFVTQPVDQQILVVDGTGASSTRIGRPGRGPGEFMSIGRIGILGDTLYAGDATGRVSFFDLDGTLLASRDWAMPPPAPSTESVSYMRSIPHVIRPDGTALLFAAVGLPVPPGFQDPGVFKWMVPRWFLRIDGSGEPINTIFRTEVAETTMRMTGGSDGFAMREPFFSGPLTTIMADGSGIVVVDREPAPDTRESSFRVTLIDPQGDTTFMREFLYSPVAITSADVRRALTIAEQDMPPGRTVPPLADRERALREAGLVPATHVPVEAVETGQDGTIWIKLGDPAGSEEALWMVLEGASGDVSGMLVLPTGENVVAARDDILVTSVTDELDVPYLHRYRLIR